LSDVFAAGKFKKALRSRLDVIGQEALALPVCFLCCLLDDSRSDLFRLASFVKLSLVRGAWCRGVLRVRIKPVTQRPALLLEAIDPFLQPTDIWLMLSGRALFSFIESVTLRNNSPRVGALTIRP
jgi:hypothetical protein